MFCTSPTQSKIDIFKIYIKSFDPSCTVCIHIFFSLSVPFIVAAYARALNISIYLHISLTWFTLSGTHIYLVFFSCLLHAIHARVSSMSRTGLGRFSHHSYSLANVRAARDTNLQASALEEKKSKVRQTHCLTIATYDHAT